MCMIKGLDSASATSVVGAMKTLAENIGVMIICTIHQPSLEVFSEFSHVTLLSHGRMVYSGKRCNIMQYFQSKGYSFPLNTNPADHVLKITNSEFTSSENLDNLFNMWNKHRDVEVELPHLGF